MSAPAIHRGLSGIPRPELKRQIPGALRTVFGIFRSWGLKDTQAQILLAVPRSTFERWKKHPDSARLSRDQVERVSYLLGIRKALEILLPGEEARRVEQSWITRPNLEPVFGGRPPLDRMLAGRVADLYEVRRYLDGQRGW